MIAIRRQWASLFVQDSSYDLAGGEIMRVDFRANSYDISVINVYLPNGQFSVKEWDKVLASLPGKFIILGDFNCHNPAWGSSRMSAGGFELDKAIRSLKDSAPGQDDLTRYAITVLADDCKYALLEAYNKSWNLGLIPKNWKEAIVIPFLKPGGDSALVSSYRPISLTQILAKVMERMILNRLLPRIQQSKRLSIMHYGFIPNRSCLVLLNKLFSSILHHRKQRKVVQLVALDLKAAFDSVWHDGLLYKIMQFGVKGNSILWIANFLNQRTIRVKWRGVLSRSYDTISGVPQGCILSPIFFTIFMHDIYEIIPANVDCYVYADDIFLYSADVSPSKVVSNLQRALFKVHRWAKEWNLCISPEKSKSIIFGGTRSSEENLLKLDGVSIPTEDHIKILGMWFDSKLSWNVHVNKIVPKLERMLNAFKFIASPRWGARKVDLVNVANATIRGRIEYGSCLLLSTSQQNKKKLEIVYNHALRLAIGAPISTPLPLLYVEAGVCKYKWSKLRKPISQCVKDKLSNLDLDLNNCITFNNELDFSEEVKCCFKTNEYEFQNKNLSDVEIQQFFRSTINDYVNQGFKIYATDASKSDTGVGIAAVDRTSAIVSQRIDNRNSIFSAEAWAICKLLEILNPRDKIAILTDSNSVVSALSCVHRRSNSLILKLFERIKSFHYLTVIWVPGHKGIGFNERADKVAKRRNMNNLGDISAEDACRFIENTIKKEQVDSWRTSYTGRRFSYCNVHCEWSKGLNIDRKMEVAISKTRLQMLDTTQLLHRYRRANSPFCDSCYTIDSTEHAIIHCTKYDSARNIMLKKMKISNIDLLADLLNHCNKKPWRYYFLGKFVIKYILKNS
ncbi:uncharacterized protein LOC118196661 [Stegodyphus dumicola]|uniref:uncharacterized protein LOC118196661 n=1 Tax=Stegodyphus dumicola TaxID=202533 RepID=UPI0015B0FB3D|nr:uncharacterized protein LOC118196661 [Stegodyphus dumicola]